MCEYSNTFLADDFSYRDVHTRPEHIRRYHNPSFLNVSRSLTQHCTQTQTSQEKKNNNDESTPSPKNHRFSGEPRKTQTEQWEHQQKQQMGKDTKLWRWSLKYWRWKRGGKKRETKGWFPERESTEMISLIVKGPSKSTIMQKNRQEHKLSKTDGSSMRRDVFNVSRGSIFGSRCSSIGVSEFV